MIINHNIAALNTHRQMGSAQSAQMNSMEKLSSGLRINSAKDDAAGLSISEKMRGQIRGLEQGSRNAQDGVSMLQTAEGALNETHDILQRMRELAVQASNDTNTTEDREAIQNEANQLAKDVNRIAKDTQFNGQDLLTGIGGPAGDGDFTFQVGANQDQQITVTFADMTGATGLSIATDDTEAAAAIDISSTSAVATVAITTINDAIKAVSAERSNIGANQNRLEYATNNLNTSAENLTAAESRIRDVDMAKEMMEQTKNSILAQASQAMLTQANQAPQQVLQLLR
ncbi:MULTISPECIES: flagellin [unclassified Planococcus (in: firmicutes)]|uniref:flagellin N-terminal helical domain-containing protein n=1 Tax=unclassified Planococcus (in: firmicutes) TaxID=2662419 RepID=UPI000C32FB30|nr:MULTISPECIES: flagellin [unclassified Planococcus (in: firmicutes)]AUD12688.1 flagellin [Planococcus sp. MB-3u-03]PKG46784.1 flagellin [Planococcus sp. Urea-trap-24]PKG89629.1 flagellin [Planococcus sp. Urea-3u-39]PKH36062.1 flagellin [Planococcus sp. MB-3u-09]